MAKPQTSSLQSSTPPIQGMLYHWLQTLVPVCVVIVLCLTLVGRITAVDGDSMYPTLHDGDLMVVQSLGYTPQPGDVVIFSKPFRTFHGAIVKRVIAVGGQTVRIDYMAGTVTVDGQLLEEPYLAQAMAIPWYDNSPVVEVTVPEGELFVMGDNRNGSNDSRDPELGTVDTRYVLGRAVLILAPLSDFGPLPTP